MKKLKQKILSLITGAAVAVLSGAAASYAAGPTFHRPYDPFADILTEEDLALAVQTCVPMALWSLTESEPGCWGWDYTPEDLNAAVLGKPLRYAQIIDGEAQIVPHRAFFPLFLNGDAIGEITVDKFDGRLVAGWCGGTAYYLDGVIDENPGEDIVIYAPKKTSSVVSGGTFAVTEEGDIISFQNFPNFPLFDEFETAPSKSEVFEKLYVPSASFNAETVDDGAVLAEIVMGFYSTAADEARDLKARYGTPLPESVTSVGLMKTDFIRTGRVTPALRSAPVEYITPIDESYLLNTGGRQRVTLQNYPVVQQGNYNLCWAASIASMISYEYPFYNGITAASIANQYGIDYTDTYYDGESSNTTRNILDDYMLSNYKVNLASGDRTRAQVVTSIDTYQDGIIMVMSGASHMVVVCGYTYWTRNLFSMPVMDPNFPVLMATEMQEYGDVFQYKIDGVNYDWDVAIYFSY